MLLEDLGRAWQSPSLDLAARPFRDAEQREKHQMHAGKFGIFFGLSLAVAACNAATVDEPSAVPANPDELAFSLDNMDTSVDPADDFYHYAAGGWLDRVERPESMSQLAFMQIVMKRMDAQLKDLVEEAAAQADDAELGAPEQQVGALYKAYMDIDSVNAAGMAPLQPELDRLDAVSSKEELAAYLAHFSKVTNKWPLLKVEVAEGIDDATVNTVLLDPSETTLQFAAIYDMEEGAPPRGLFEDYIAGILQVAGVSDEEARSIAGDTLAIETTLHNGESDPVLMVDFRNWNNPRTIDQLREQMSGFDFDKYLDGLGLEASGKIVVTNKDFPSAVAQVWNDYSLDQLKGFLKFRMIQSFAGVLSTEFQKPNATFNKALGFASVQPERSESAMQFLKLTLPQPLGKIYVDNFFEKETKNKGEDMIRRVQAEFRKRVESNEWLDESTRDEALRKVDAFYYKVGIPDRWIDYSGVEIGDNLVQSLINANTFWVERNMAQQGKPTERWAFSNATHTAPMVVNAAYNPSANGFEVTAAIAQPPAFQVDMDAPVYFCRLGAVIGHEMTHGFDSGGRAFDHKGSMRNWFTDDDTEYFENQASRLVAQGDTYEPLPGEFMKGGLTVKENLADIGGVSLAYDALMTYLEENPEENVKIDGFTPTQRCFIAWAQLWAEKSSEQMIRLQLEDNHAPGPYRTYAPLQHLDAFYDAFEIEEGDPMWLPPEKRVRVW